MRRGAGTSPGDPRHFRTGRSFRTWLERNHATVPELWVGFYRKATGKAGMTYSEAVDEALCWGWIDGIKKRVDEERYTHRFTPRKPVSNWSPTNLKRYAELDAAGRIAPPGREAFARFDPSKQRARPPTEAPTDFSPASRRSFAAHPAAWVFFQDQPPGYRRTAIAWVESARREDTRARRLARLIEFSAAGERVPEVSGRPARKRP